MEGGEPAAKKLAGMASVARPEPRLVGRTIALFIDFNFEDLEVTATVYKYRAPWDIIS